jgi:hypothetical protein
VPGGLQLMTQLGYNLGATKTGRVAEASWHGRRQSQAQNGFRNCKLCKIVDTFAPAAVGSSRWNAAGDHSRRLRRNSGPHTRTANFQ